MPRALILGTVSILGLASAAAAEVPKVATDIAPIHSLAAIVMGDLGAPDLLVQPGASPHGYSMRPSEAEALDRADVVFWVGEGLDPWLVGPIQALAGDAHAVELVETEGSVELPFREGATFEKHDHDHEDEGDHADADHDHDAPADEDHADDDHADEDHEHEDEQADADHADADGHDHDHEGHDPHAWLDPENGRVWLDVIATELSELDPDNAETYRANAAAGRAELASLIDDVSAELDPVRGTNFVVFHDAYQYFENRFDIPATGSITLGDATDPSPARIEEIHHKVQELGVACAFAEPQYNASLVATVFQGTDAKIGVMDPLGTDLELGPDLYPQLIRNVAGSLVGCLN